MNLRVAVHFVPVTYKRLWTDTVELRVFVQESVYN